ncbi:response regulator transcription factor [Streptomyces aidingensis]|uniref:DNA-binding response regulator, OmpR family, contains REC and winged-helix (WHTH) domain n=1 Tax=Streptomyces aidingensis TaxID=910347 RepID=A0A1I1HHH8_9ACTN|nr:response regulator transcription factor [Streptomyces aidingensis]SFC23032.1 DNA-binding response regulator, OmpR family, contains REC and winged-helix (wHTH) domain [Streptomyces aidingensis]
MGTWPVSAQPAWASAGRPFAGAGTAGYPAEPDDDGMADGRAGQAGHAGLTAADTLPGPRSLPPEPDGRPSGIPLGSHPVVLLADADERIRQGLTTQLAKYQVSVVHCADGATALLEVGLRKPDVLLISAELPVLDGATVLRLVRRRMSIPVVLGVGPDDTHLVAPALAAGASACVARPYRPREVAQLLSLSDRSARNWDQPVVCGPLTLDPSTYEVRMHGVPTARLPLREFQLLHLLMQNAEKVITRERIRAELWGDGARRSNTITVHIRRLRERLGDDPHHPDIIQTVRGVGYRLVPPS